MLYIAYNILAGTWWRVFPGSSAKLRWPTESPKKSNPSYQKHPEELEFRQGPEAEDRKSLVAEGLKAA